MATPTYKLSHTGDTTNIGIGIVNNFDAFYVESVGSAASNFIVQKNTPTGIVPVPVIAYYTGLKVSFRNVSGFTGGAALLQIEGLGNPVRIYTISGTDPTPTEVPLNSTVSAIYVSGSPDVWIIEKVVRDRLSRGFNIQDYGALPDYDILTNTGTDNTAFINDTIAAAIAASETGTLIEAPFGLYLTQGGHDVLKKTIS